MKKVKELLSFPDQFPDEIFRYLDISRDKFASELKKLWERSVTEVKNIEGIQGGNLKSLYEYFEDLIELHKQLTTLRSNTVSLKEKIQQYAKIKEAFP